MHSASGVIMSKSFGVSLDEKIADGIERKLEYGDSRSQRIEELVAAGLKAEELCNDFGIEYNDRHEFQSLITQAFLALDEQREKEQEQEQEK